VEHSCLLQPVRCAVPACTDAFRLGCRTAGKEELRNQVGQFRFDLKNIASSKSSKEDRKQGLAKAKDLITACERLDYQMTKKSSEGAAETYKIVLDKLKDFDSFTAA
jgi:Oxygen evolving enhancer protein 3 (PsbQ)